MYSQLVFVLDSVPALVKAKPELADQEPFKTVLTGDLEAVAKLPKADLEKLLMATLDRHDRRRFPRQRHEVDGGGQGSSLEAALYRPHLPADAGGAAVPPRQRLQDLHRHRRRPGLRPDLRREDLRRSPRAGDRQRRRDDLRIRQGRQAVPDQGPEAPHQRQRRRQARVHLPDDRPPAPRSVRQHRRRPADARIHRRRRRPAAGDAGPPRRRGA